MNDRVSSQMKMAGSYAMKDWFTPSGPEGSSGNLILMCRRVPGHFFAIFFQAGIAGTKRTSNIELRTLNFEH